MAGNSSGVSGLGWDIPYASEVPKKPVPTAPAAPMDTYPAAIKQGSQDYDRLMKMYEGMFNDPNANGNQANLTAQYTNAANGQGNVAYQPINYQKSPDVSNSLSNLSGLAANGGYTAQGIADLRARGTAPIRSVYASAQRNIDRAKRLQGGYSPNYTAATASLTRGLSDATSRGLQDVNAGIAQNVASNRIGIAPSYASAAANENAASTDVNKFNSSNQLEADKFNAAQKQNALSGLAALYSNGGADKRAILDAMTRLYASQPGNAALYGQQAATARGQDLQQQSMGNNASSSLINSFVSGMRI